MAEFPAMPLWTDAYLADTRHLSDAEHGRYLLMLMDMWRAPGCRFPNDGEWLARRFRRSPEDFDREVMPLLKEFCSCDGNWWTQKRLAREWQRLQETSRKQSARAKSRWNKENDDCPGNASAAMPYPQPQPIRKNGDASASSDDPSARYYRAGKALLGKNAGGQLTRLKETFGLDRAEHAIAAARSKENPAEWLAAAIKKHTKPPRRDFSAGLNDLLKAGTDE